MSEADTLTTAANNEDTKTDGDELTNVSTCSSSNLSITQASSERDPEDHYADLGLCMFEGLQVSTLKRFTWGDTTKPKVRVALHVVDEEPGALQSGHYLWPAGPSLAQFMMENVLGTSALSCLREPGNVLELGAGSALLSLTALQLMHESLQCIVVTDHDPGTLERARDNYETTLEDLLESTQTEEEQFDCINGLASVPIMFETLEWGEMDRAEEVSSAAADHSSPVRFEETSPEGGAASHQPEPLNPNHNSERNIFDLLLGSDLIYCESVVKPLFASVSYFMTREGSFLLSQSTSFDEETERKIDETCLNLNWNRIILKDTLLKDKTEEDGVRIQQFHWSVGSDEKKSMTHLQQWRQTEGQDNVHGDFFKNATSQR